MDPNYTKLSLPERLQAAENELANITPIGEKRGRKPYGGMLSGMRTTVFVFCLFAAFLLSGCFTTHLLFRLFTVGAVIVFAFVCDILTSKRGSVQVYSRKRELETEIVTLKKRIDRVKTKQVVSKSNDFDAEQRDWIDKHRRG